MTSKHLSGKTFAPSPLPFFLREPLISHLTAIKCLGIGTVWTERAEATEVYRLPKPADLIPKHTAFDQEGIPMYQEKEGKPLYNHPVRLANNIINFITSYGE
ncbi:MULTISPECIES: hypothetical protein [Thermoactinomyces]|jgi:hypothetical protein|uniref:Uncharacterized protein n=1 Tax=Thermoactinomyces daqus TaxID=1329516 RepID=A0A7W2AK86_9BACL|nr:MULTISPECIES: hypothetical protein [Thermoactinomyces]MBA4544678.1 hypothetical protein [Thermoactinomyces daqus]MBH8596502.1 hypothetical protein [Thermoactinomyces sp. CICC 10523]